jgi:hypothetical protein
MLSELMRVSHMLANILCKDLTADAETVLYSAESYQQIRWNSMDKHTSDKNQCL